MIREISLLLLSFIEPSQSAGVTQASEVETGASIIASVARYAYEKRQYASRSDSLMPTIKVDPRLVMKKGFVPSVDNAQTHASAVTNKLGAVHGVSVVTAERADRCAAWAPADCMNAGKSIVIAFARPVITGDSASLEMFVRVSGQVSPADSAALVAKSKFSLSLRRAGMGVDRAILKRVNGEWVVVNITALVRT